MSLNSHYAIITCLIGSIPKVYLIRFTDFTARTNTISPTDIIDSKSIHQYGHMSNSQVDIILFDQNVELETLMESKITPNVESYIITREQFNAMKCKEFFLA